MQGEQLLLHFRQNVFRGALHKKSYNFFDIRFIIVYGSLYAKAEA